jgi:GTPase SAR1 family protein
MNKYNLLVVGENKVGKTSFIQKYQNLIFSEIHKPSKPVEYYQLKISTNIGDIDLHVTELADYEKIPFIGDINGAFLIFDLGNQGSIDSIDDWIQDLKKIYQKIPIVVVGNKVDLVEKINFKKYENMSCKNNLGLVEPLTELLRNMVDFSELVINKEFLRVDNLEEKK